MAIDRATTWFFIRLIAGSAMCLAGCGSDQTTDLSNDSPSTKRQALANTQNSSVSVSRLDISPPASASPVAPAKSRAADATYTQAAQAFAAQYASRYGLAAGAPEFDLLSIKRSLKGVHVTLQEKIGGIPVAESTFTTSFDKDSSSVYRVHSSVYPHQSINTYGSSMAEDAAYDIAWRYLGVSGKLTALPGAVLTYVPDSVGSGQLLLVYRIDLPVSAPFGAWRVDVDVTSGAVVAVVDTSLPRNKRAMAPSTLGSSSEPLADRNAAFAEAYARDSAKTAKAVAAKTTVNGTGLVFDPDPVTTLGDTTLADDSPAARFDNAYMTVTLNDISVSNGVYTLEGPWAKIVDWSAPTDPPSTTANGNWTAKRGNNAFNDVMTYFHVDRNQRYIQSLGYTGATGIQNAPIELDSDGYNGGDNSQFVAPNRIEYGHGYVDDNEDADVILHEYMHAITYAINNSWSRFTGDEGAMGEGFGDYWAASNNIDTFPANFDNAKVFTWDGNNGYGDWWGRRLDRTSLLYDPSQTYPDHVPIAGGVSDELWSTPLFQALLALRDAGVSKREVDTILLEAQFGLGSGVTMRQMATAIVDTAKRLYPLGPHAGILSTKFFSQNILETADFGLLAALVLVVIS